MDTVVKQDGKNKKNKKKRQRPKEKVHSQLSSEWRVPPSKGVQIFPPFHPPEEKGRNTLIIDKNLKPGGKCKCSYTAAILEHKPTLYKNS